MTSEELMAIRNLMREELSATESRIMAQVDERIKKAQSDTMKGAATLLDAQFMSQFALLADGQKDILRKMPSQEDMDIIDGTLQEHHNELKLLRQEVNSLKKAQ